MILTNDLINHYRTACDVTFGKICTEHKHLQGVFTANSPNDCQAIFYFSFAVFNLKWFLNDCQAIFFGSFKHKYKWFFRMSVKDILDAVSGPTIGCSSSSIPSFNLILALAEALYIYSYLLSVFSAIVIQGGWGGGSQREVQPLHRLQQFQPRGLPSKLTITVIFLGFCQNWSSCILVSINLGSLLLAYLSRGLADVHMRYWQQHVWATFTIIILYPQSRCVKNSLLVREPNIQLGWVFLFYSYLGLEFLSIKFNSSDCETDWRLLRITKLQNSFQILMIKDFSGQRLWQNSV